MTWTGIPFPFIETLTKDSLALQITKLPTLVINSSFSWESILGSFIAGSIPAIIAWKTIKYNNELIKRQIKVAAQQKKCDELRELFSSFLSLYDACINYMGLLFDQYLANNNSIPFEKYDNIKDDITKLTHCTNLIYLMIGTNNEYYERMTSMVNTFENKVSSYFDDCRANSSREGFSIDRDIKEFLELFNEILEMEQAKI